MRGVDYVFHAAALKQVPSCEFYPMEAVRTNVLGTENVMDAAIAAGVKRVVVPQHGQGGLSDQRHGHLQGHDGEGDGRQVAAIAGERHGDLRHAVRQRHGVARIGDPAVRRPGAGRASRSRSRTRR